ncbi:unnamed protein product [Caenorhabditis auriculariae]|uniref:Methionine synthase reductase n=1 Tax=Caenorhabditis auriculariae TaxID=2777116 RepID=A0A8S1HN43_9PELO|nr:unnamed protein product [Caenorhabditis auriculariae]
MGDFLIAYGSHTGQAETIAKELKDKAEVLGLKPRLFTLDENEKQFNLNEEKFCTIVVSSTGDGDSPENCARFVRRISRKTLADDYLAGLEYALLGLGDSNYSSYQAVPQRIDRQLKALGAKKVIETGAADDQVGLELAVEPWVEQLLKKLCERFGLNPDKLQLLNDAKMSLNPVKSDEEKKALLEEQKKLKEEEKLEEEHEHEIDVLSAERHKTLQSVPFEYPEYSLIKGKEALSKDENLRVPIAPQHYIVSTVSHQKWSQPKDLKWQNACKMVGVVTEAIEARVVGTAIVTDFEAAKPKWEILIDLGESSSRLAYEPGDAMYFIVPNPEPEVNYILKRAGMLDVADQVLELSIHPKTEKINATLPGHVHQKSSLRHLFTYCLDIRRAPGRPLLRILADSAQNALERRRLLELCSAQGMADFTEFIRQAGISVVDVLLAFPSVRPPVDRLIELLPRLMPRPYSMSSYDQRRVRFVYSEMTFTAEEGRRYQRKGLATEWLQSLRVGDTVQVLGKEPARFRLPPPPASQAEALKMPLLMVGPGTGVAVFLSFCHFLLKAKLEDEANFPKGVTRILFFGCRDAKKDSLYFDELKTFLREGILSDLVVCESQVNNERVQEGLKKSTEKVLPFLKAGNVENSKIYICGDAKGMSKDVYQCFTDIVQQGEGLTPIQAKERMLELKKTDRYVEDVWA